MKFRKLFFWMTGVITATIIVIACNDQSEKTSTASTDTTNKTPSTVAAPKKRGKVTTTMASTATNNKTMKKDKMGYYNATETAPVFKGGQSDLENYITNHIEYPQEAVDNNIEGVVNVQFTIDENGKVGNVKTIGNNLGHGLEDAAVRVVSQMPNWKPGQIKGENVKAWYTLPIVYKIEES